MLTERSVSKNESRNVKKIEEERLEEEEVRTKWK
jgi:hypothetical protein